MDRVRHHLWLWYYRWKYDLPRKPEPLVNREAHLLRWQRRLDFGTVVWAFCIAALVVTLFHYISY